MAGAVDEPGVELTAGRGDRLGCLAQVRDVVQRVVQTENLDAVLGRRRDETAHEIGPDGPRADEEATAQRQSQRRLRPGLERADPLPRALHSAPHGAVEHAAPRNLQACEARAVEDLGDLEDRSGGNPPGQRLLAEQADRGIDQYRHAGSLECFHPTEGERTMKRTALLLGTLVAAALDGRPHR